MQRCQKYQDAYSVLRVQSNQRNAIPDIYVFRNYEYLDFIDVPEMSEY